MSGDTCFIDWDSDKYSTGLSTNKYDASTIGTIDYTTYTTAASSSITNSLIDWDWNRTDNSLYKVRYTSTYKQSGIQLPCLKPLTALERLRQIIRDRHAPTIIVSKRSLPEASDIREMRARQTLRRIVGNVQFRSFLKNGFITLRAKSGLVYQLFTGHTDTRVYKDGQLVETMCIVLKGEFPPTDTLIMRYLLLLNDEERFCDVANRRKGGPANIRRSSTADTRGLPEIFRELQAA